MKQQKAVVKRMPKEKQKTDKMRYTAPQLVRYGTLKELTEETGYSGGDAYCASDES